MTNWMLHLIARDVINKRMNKWLTNWMLHLIKMLDILLQFYNNLDSLF